MSEMVERAVKAMEDRASKDPCTIEDVARAVIEAMREPTDKMSDVGYGIETDRYACHHPQEDKCAVECWQAMIDAALKDT